MNLYWEFGGSKKIDVVATYLIFHYLNASASASVIPLAFALASSIFARSMMESKDIYDGKDSYSNLPRIRSN